MRSLVLTDPKHHLSLASEGQLVLLVGPHSVMLSAPRKVGDQRKPTPV